MKAEREYMVWENVWRGSFWQSLAMEKAMECAFFL